MDLFLIFLCKPFKLHVTVFLEDRVQIIMNFEWNTGYNVSPTYMYVREDMEGGLLLR